MNYLLIKKIALKVLLALLLCSCLPEAEKDTKKIGGKIKDEQTYEIKTVDVIKFTKVDNKPFNFDAEIPNKIHLSNGILYLSRLTSQDLWMWDIRQGNNAKAWTKAQIFEGTDKDANDAITTASGIQSFQNINGGVLLGFTGARSGISVFLGNSTRALYSKEWPFLVAQVNNIHAMKDVALKNGLISYYFSVETTAPSHNIAWFSISNLSESMQGINNVGNQVLYYSDGATPPNRIDTTAPMTALHLYEDKNGDEKLLIAKQNGLLSVDRTNIGVLNDKDPKVEQANNASFLSATHNNEWAFGGVSPSSVSFLSQIGDYMLITFNSTSPNPSGFKIAKIEKNKPLVFIDAKDSEGNTYDSKDDKILSLKVYKDEALLLTQARVLQFKDGKIYKRLFSGDLSKKAYLTQGYEVIDGNPPLDFDKETFQGGTEGKVPADGTMFYDIAIDGDRWALATNNGVFFLEAYTVTKKFDADGNSL